MLEENFEHSKFWFNIAKKKNIPFIYASSSAVYGNSSCFKVKPSCERPHNEYAFSKWLFDNYVRYNLDNIKNKVIGFRFFNVFGWGEFHKGRNASLPYRFYSFIKEKGYIDVFNEDIKRDYVWVEDVCEILYKSWKENLLKSGIYNLGSGCPISHKEIAQLIVDTVIEEGIIDPGKSYIKPVPVPEELKNRFQYFTKAEDLPQWIREITKDKKQKIKYYIKQLCKGGIL
jgi:ADP-L-glycero-D-manno-heptose 6-epimerase